MKRTVHISLFVLAMLVSVFTVHAQDKSYINNHKVMATLLSQYYGIPAPVILSVAAVESSGGAGPAAKVLNNHFGIVGKNDFVNRFGHSSRYKQYPNVLASYIDFCELLTRKHFYHRLKGSNNCKAWVEAISHAGYSEVPVEWTQKVMSVLTTIKTETSSLLPSVPIAVVE